MRNEFETLGSLFTRAGHAEFLGVVIDHLDLALSEVGGMAMELRGEWLVVSECLVRWMISPLGC